MRWWAPWRRETRRNDEALRAAEQLRDRAVEQRRRVEAITPRVDAAVTSLRRLRSENHFDPMIENVLRGTPR
jgi:hypothetical protein